MRPALHPTRPLSAAAGAVAILLAAGCSSGPDMGELSPSTFYARYSGEWQIEAASAEQARETMDGWAPETAARPGANRRPGGGMGGRPGGMGGRGSGRRPGTSGMRAPDPATMRALMQIARVVPHRLIVTVDDSTATVAGLHTGILVLPFGKRMDLPYGDAELEARAKWDGAVLVVERGTDMAAVVDRFEPGPEPDRMILTRRFEMGPGARPELAFAFHRTPR